MGSPPVPVSCSEGPAAADGRRLLCWQRWVGSDTQAQVPLPPSGQHSPGTSSAPHLLVGGAPPTGLTGTSLAKRGVRQAGALTSPPGLPSIPLASGSSLSVCRLRGGEALCPGETAQARPHSICSGCRSGVSLMAPPHRRLSALSRTGQEPPRETSHLPLGPARLSLHPVLWLHQPLTHRPSQCLQVLRMGAPDAAGRSRELREGCPVALELWGCLTPFLLAKKGNETGSWPTAPLVLQVKKQRGPREGQ